MANLLSTAGFNGRNGNHFELRLEVDGVSSTEGNYTDLIYTLKMKSSDGYSGGGSTAYGYINGEVVGSFNSIGADTTITIGSRTIREYHNQDGTKTASFSADIDTSWDLGDAHTDGTWQLVPINRYATITSAPNFTDEDNPTITYNNPLGNNVNQLKGCIAFDHLHDNIPYRDIPKTGNSYTFEFTQEEKNTLLNSIPNNTSKKVYFYIRTKIGNDLYHTYLERTFSIVNGNPVFSNYDIEDANNTTKTLTGSTSNNVINVNGYSNIKATISTVNKASAIKGASMSKYRFVIGDVSTDITYSDDSSVNGTINNASSGVYNLYAIDSRNNSTLVTKQAVSTINYQNIIIDKQNSNFERNNNQVGEYGILNLSGTFWNNTFGQVTNTIKSVTYRFKKVENSTWIPGTTQITSQDITISGNNFNINNKQIAGDGTGGKWDLDANYNLEVTVTDELSTATIEFILNSAIPTLSLDKEGVGVMCGYDSDIGGLLQVGGKIIDGGNLLWTNTSPTSSFAGQTITLDDNIDDFYEILYTESNTNSIIMSTGLIPVGYGTRLNYVSGYPKWRTTSTSVSGNTITFNNCNSLANFGTTVIENTSIIPIYVISYKSNKI